MRRSLHSAGSVRGRNRYACAISLAISNPATGELLRELPAADAAAATVASGAPGRPSRPGARCPSSERAAALRRLARALRDDPTFVDTLIGESGKPRYEAEGIELFYTLELTRYLHRAGGPAGAARRPAPPVRVREQARARGPSPARRGGRHRALELAAAQQLRRLRRAADGGQRRGPQAFRAHAADVAARSPSCGRRAGLPADVFQVVAGRGEAGEALTEAADMMFFTGSAEAGQQVAARAAERLVPAVIELGGKSPMIVLADADLPRAARAAVWSGFAHSGQVCIRTERVLVEAAWPNGSSTCAAAEIARLRQGAPGRARRRHVDVGADHLRAAGRARRAHIADAVARGGRVVDRRRAARRLPGRFFAPTLLADVTPEMAVMREETFGPVLPIMRVADAEEALRVANDSPIGLSGSVWSRDARARAGAGPAARVRQRVRERRAGELLLCGGAARRHQGERTRRATDPKACGSSAGSRPSSRISRCSGGCRRRRRQLTFPYQVAHPPRPALGHEAILLSKCEAEDMHGLGGRDRPSTSPQVKMTGSA